jgi:protein tyrosine phosphatase (PTP) superfamily phosphohydrolase (DUF442 family)
MSSAEIFNFIRIDDKTITAGQPTEDQLRSVSGEGYQAVINLATIDPRYSLDDEEKSCESLGMSYFHIPVEWENPRVEDYEEFKRVMTGLADQKVLIHCAANYRVTAFYAAYAKLCMGWSDEQAVNLRARIWESNPDWQMDAAWSDFIQAIDGL